MIGDMEQLVAMATNALILSAMYILVALGFAFVFNMMGVLNLAHGAIYMVGGYLGLALIQGWGFNPWAALLLTTLVMAVFGIFLEKFCFRPFVGDFNRTIMVCVVITIVLQTAVNIIAGTQVLSLPPFVEGISQIGTLRISNERLATFACGAVLLAAVVWFVKKTNWGRQMQAIAQDAEAGALQGINVKRISALACAMGCGLAAIAGCLVGAYLNLGPFMGDFMLIKILMIVILAGVGSTSGIFITGFALGVLDAVLPIIFNGAVSDAIAVLTMLVLLLIKPQGFFGHES
jgi:branched-chain amino acid transport system permease protein